MVNYCGNYKNKKYGSYRGGENTSSRKKSCGGEYCQNQKTKIYERDKSYLNRTLVQKHDGKYCRPRNDKRKRNPEGRIIRKYTATSYKQKL